MRPLRPVVAACLAAAGLLAAMLALAGAAGPRAPGAVSPRLARALADPGSPARDADGRLAVWVHFRDRDLRGGELASALDAAERDLDPRAARRRELRGARGAAGRLADAGDLPVAPRYLAAVAATGAEPRRASRWLNAASFDATPDQVAAIAALPFVRGVDLVAKLRRTAPPPPSPLAPVAARRDGAKGAAEVDSASFGLSLPALVQLDVPGLHAAGWTGSGVVVALLDTGFRTTHEAIAHVPVLDAWDFVQGDAVVANQAGDLPSQHNHGTWILSALAARAPGLLSGTAPEVAVLLAKTEDVASETPVEEDNWVAGLEWAEARGADLVSASLGYFDWYTYADLDGDTAVTTRAADAAAARGLLVVTAAGNERLSDWGHIIAPADADSALAVGAVQLSGAIAPFSSPGPTADGRIKPDVCALGWQVPVVSVSNDTSAVAVSGTSLATPLVAGVAALMLQHAPGLTPAQVIAALRATAGRAAAPDNDFGWGVVDAAAAVAWYGPRIAHAALPDTLPPAIGHRVACRIEDRAPLDPPSLHLIWREVPGAWQARPLLPAGPDSFCAWLPAVTPGVVLEYWLVAADSVGVTATWPAAGAADPLRVTIAGATTGADTPPVARTVLLPAAPNPFNPRTTLRFELARAGHARLELFDLRGRRVRTLVDATLDAGPHAVVWDGTDGAGRAVAGGAYLARLSAGDAVLVRRLALAK